MPHVNVVEMILGVVRPVLLEVLCREEDIVPDVGGLDGRYVAAAYLRFAVSLGHCDLCQPLGSEHILVSL